MVPAYRVSVFSQKGMVAALRSRLYVVDSRCGNVPKYPSKRLLKLPFLPDSGAVHGECGLVMGSCVYGCECSKTGCQAEPGAQGLCLSGWFHSRPDIAF